MKNEHRSAYLVGSGIASLSAVALLIRDTGFKGENIHILEEQQVAGGASGGSGDPHKGYVTRSGHMFTEETYVYLWNVLDSIPSLDDPKISIKQQAWAFNAEWRSDSHARLTDGQRRILDATDLGFNLHDRSEITRLLATPEGLLHTLRIEDCLSPYFFETNFWVMWCTAFAFQNWHSATEFERHMLRFLREFPCIHTLAGTRRTPLNQYDTIVRPMEQWPKQQGVVFEYGTKVEDVDSVETDDGRRIGPLCVARGGQSMVHGVRQEDLVLITTGLMVADASYGDDHRAPELVCDKHDGAWTLWETMAYKEPGLERPNVFYGNVDESKWESSTLTMRSPVLVHRIETFTGNAPGTGSLMTFKDSSWLVLIVVFHASHFAGQPRDMYTLWGYGFFVDNKGDYIDKMITQATGQEILTELLYHLYCEDIFDEVCRTTIMIPVMMPYTTSELEHREPSDRSPVTPYGAKNFALLGQYVEIPQDVVLTVEYSVRDAMHAAYGLLGLKNEIPAIYHGIADLGAVFAGLKTLLSRTAGWFAVGLY